MTELLNKYWLTVRTFMDQHPPEVLVYSPYFWGIAGLVMIWALVKRQKIIAAIDFLVVCVVVIKVFILVSTDVAGDVRIPLFFLGVVAFVGAVVAYWVFIKE
jgi:predicted membrane channel-forming protein YqfA (hemolysin III family)